MNDRQIDRLVRKAQPHAGPMVESLGLDGGGQELLEEIMSTTTTPQVGPSGPEPEEVFDDVSLAIVSAAPALPVVIVPGSGQILEATIGNPRLLVDDPAWKITHVVQYNPLEGSIWFVNGRQTLEVNWSKADTYQEDFKEPSENRKPVPFVVLGREGAMFTYGSNDFSVWMAPLGKNFVEFRGQGGDKAAFKAVMGKLKQVSDKEWLAAMPTSVVTPARREKVAKQMLSDVPLPPGYDASKLSAEGTNSYYQYGVEHQQAMEGASAHGQDQ